MISRDAPITTVVFATIDPPGQSSSGFALPWIDDALASAAVGVILDLEDTTAPAHKDLVRSRLNDYAHVGERLWVRINDVESSLWREDLAAAAPVASVILLPKVISSSDVVQVAAQLAAHGSSAKIVAIVETAAGLAGLHDICREPTGRLVTVLLGMGDLTRDMGVTYTGWGEIENYARARVVEATVTARLAPPIDTAALILDDRDFFLAEAAVGKRMGFGGKCCLALTEVEMATEVFQPSEAEIAGARAVVAAYLTARAAGEGILSVGGTLVDAPIARRAAGILRGIGEHVEI